MPTADLLGSTAGLAQARLLLSRYAITATMDILVAGTPLHWTHSWVKSG
jgi:hypothetical protein